MSEQYGFDFGEPPDGRWRPHDREGLFLAIFPDDKAVAMASKIGALVLRANGIVTPLHRPERLHVSLCCIRKAPRLHAKDVFAATRAAEAVSMPPFDVQFDRVASWKAQGPDRRNPLVLLGGGVELVRLMEMLVERLRDNGLRRGFGAPHMTLVYDDKVVAEQPVSPVRWKVKEFALVHSERGLTNYIFKGRWPLR